MKRIRQQNWHHLPTRWDRICGKGVMEDSRRLGLKHQKDVVI